MGQLVRAKHRPPSIPPLPGSMRRRSVLIPLLIVAGVVAAALLLLLAFRLSRPAALPNISVAGTEVGGLDQAALRRSVEQLAARRGQAEITILRPAAAGTEEVTATATPNDIGYQIDQAATVQAVMARGRQANPVAALADHLVATFGSITVEPIDDFDRQALTSWSVRTVSGLTSQLTEASVEFRGDRVRPVHPKPGATVARADVVAAGMRESRAPSGEVVRIPTSVVLPRTTEEQLDVLLRQARRAVRGPVRLTRGDAAIELSPEEIASVLRVDHVEDGNRLLIDLVADAAALGEVIGDRAAALESAPVDATFTLGSDGIQVVPSRRGFRFDARRAAAQLVDVATSRDREARLRGVRAQPEFTTREARALEITEQVSSFTTYHSCCQPRVTNIHRIADIVRGTVVRPGEAFSMNELVGQRTTANGFVPAPAIRNGEFVDEIGGGISQFATTTFNAIFFGGYEILEYRAHSYYFSRYPMGREATVSWPSPDLRFRNNSDAGIYIHTSYSDTAISVTFFGNVDWTVDSATGSPSNITAPETQCRENRAVARGETRTVQEGSEGFDVVVTRFITFPNGRRSEESFFTRYKAQPTIVEQRSCP